MPSTTPQADHYAREYHNWRWQVPEFFNVSTACVHRWAAHAERSASTAITWEDESGSVSYTHLDVYKRQATNLLIAPPNPIFPSPPRTDVSMPAARKRT